MDTPLLHFFLNSEQHQQPFVSDLDHLLRYGQVSRHLSAHIEDCRLPRELLENPTALCCHLPLFYLFDCNVLDRLWQESTAQKQAITLFSEGKPVAVLGSQQRVLSLLGPDLSPSTFVKALMQQSESIELRDQSLEGFVLQKSDVAILPSQPEDYPTFLSSTGLSPALQLLNSRLLLDLDWAQKAVFPVNNESLDNSWRDHLTSLESINSIYLPATGIKPLTILSEFLGSNPKNIVFYDISPLALSYYQALLHDWPFSHLDRYLINILRDEAHELCVPLRANLGVPLHGLLSANSIKKAGALIREQLAQAAQVCRSDLPFRALRAWLAERNLHFIVGDILNQGLPRFPGGNFIWLSNILSYRPTFLWSGGQQGLRSRMQSLLKPFIAQNEPCYLWGDLRPLQSEWFAEARQLSQLMDRHEQASPSLSENTTSGKLC
jgi:hypothetical protein